MFGSRIFFDPFFQYHKSCPKQALVPLKGFFGNVLNGALSPTGVLRAKLKDKHANGKEDGSEDGSTYNAPSLPDDVTLQGDIVGATYSGERSQV